MRYFFNCREKNWFDPDSFPWGYSINWNHPYPDIVHHTWSISSITLSLYVSIIPFIIFSVNSIALWIPEVTNRMVYHHDTHDGDNRYTLCEIMSQHAEAVRQTNLTNSVCETSANAAMFVPNVIQAILQPVFMVFISLVVPYVDRRYFISEFASLIVLIDVVP